MPSRAHAQRTTALLLLAASAAGCEALTCGEPPGFFAPASPAARATFAKQLTKYREASAAARPSDGVLDLAPLDFSWMAELSRFDHWSLDAHSPWEHERPFDYTTAPIPDFLELIRWAKLRLLRQVWSERGETGRFRDELAGLEHPEPRRAVLERQVKNGDLSRSGLAAAPAEQRLRLLGGVMPGRIR